VFASGFNMQRGNFFANIRMVLLLGVLCTFLCFFLFSLITIGVNNLGFMQKYSGETGEWSLLELTNAECMLMCSLLCSSDVIAAISIVSYDKQPTLFSIVFGEGIINDAVSIILFNTVLKFTSKNTEITISSPFTIAWDFGMLSLQSLCLGALFAMASSLLLKNFRSFTKNPVHESMIIFCFGYLAYVCSEVIHASGIITLLTCGVVMAHYTWYNLSPQGKQSSFIVFQFNGFVFEAFVFSYLGLTFFSYQTLDWSPDLFLCELIVIMVGRFIGTVGMVSLLDCCGYQSGMSLKELVFIWYAGMIRGAIAFGLVLRLDTSNPNRDVIVTTSLSLVIFTTVVFGSTVGVLSKCLFGSNVEETIKKIYSSKPTTLVSTPENPDGDDSFESVDLSELSDDESSYERLIHPNEEHAPKTHRHHYRGCSKYLHRLDEMIMKPILIYRYEKSKQKQSKEFFELFRRDGQVIEDEFKKEQHELHKKEHELHMLMMRDTASQGHSSKFRPKRRVTNTVTEAEKEDSGSSSADPENLDAIN